MNTNNQISYSSRYDLERKIRSLSERDPSAALIYWHRLNKARAMATKMDNNGETVGEIRSFALSLKNCHLLKRKEDNSLSL